MKISVRDVRSIRSVCRLNFHRFSQMIQFLSFLSASDFVSFDSAQWRVIDCHYDYRVDAVTLVVICKVDVSDLIYRT
jgi:hypothetical protein